jgi:hypothetical protein
MDFSDSGDPSLRRAEAQAALPTVLALARRLLADGFSPSDPEAAALQAQIEACVVAAHRLVLRSRVDGRPHGDEG